jgi:1-acyl-sn-glycerol-3-phosphate acyltransferase
MLITYKNVELMGLNAASLVAMAGGIFILPYVTFSATAGQLADHYDKSLVIKVTKITELIIMSLAAIGFVTESYGILLFVLFLMGAQSAFFSPVKFGSLPEILEEDELTLGNAFIGAGTFIAILIGTITGGASAGLDDAVSITSAGIIIVSVLGIMTAWKQRRLKDEHESVKIDYTCVKPTIDILKTTFKEKNVMHAILGISWFWFFGAAILSLLPALVKDLFSGTAMVGTIFLATFTVGMGIGAFFCNKLSGKRVEVGMVPLAAVGMSIFLFDMFYTAGSWAHNPGRLLGIQEFFAQSGSFRVLFDLMATTIFGGMFIIPQQAHMQKSARPIFLARTIAANNIWNSVFMVLAAVILMVLHAMKVSLPNILGIMAMANLIYGILIYTFYAEEMWRFIAQLLCKVMYDLDVDGEENIPGKGPIIVASNHVCFVDWLFIMAVSPRPIRWVIDHIYYNIFPAKYLFKQAKLIPVATKKENPDLLDRAFDKMNLALDEERCLGIFPEGYLTRDGSMRKFQPGIKKIVDKTGAQVVPIVINGAWGSYFSHAGSGAFKGMNIFTKRKIHLTILPPIDSESFCFKDLEGLISERYNQETSELV